MSDIILGGVGSVINKQKKRIRSSLLFEIMNPTGARQVSAKEINNNNKKYQSVTPALKKIKGCTMIVINSQNYFGLGIVFN